MSAGSAAAPVPSALARTLQAHRQAQGLTMTALAHRSGVSRVGIAYLESGRRPYPYFTTVAALSRALGVSLDTLPATDSSP